MVITREFSNNRNHYTIDGEKVSEGDLRAYCGKYLSGYGLQSMFNRLNLTDKVVVEVDGAYVYAGIREMYAEDELKSAKRKIAQLEEKLAAVRQACSA
ncbi:MAG: hypothetical protein IJS29_01110 [Selenomonadaceae bacterium]|nr:hypothetical protein [Selenomonadaceae bacterium]